jgi:hypothetical protein
LLKTLCRGRNYKRFHHVFPTQSNGWFIPIPVKKLSISILIRVKISIFISFISNNYLPFLFLMSQMTQASQKSIIQKNVFPDSYSTVNLGVVTGCLPWWKRNPDRSLSQRRLRRSGWTSDSFSNFISLESNLDHWSRNNALS